MEKTENEDIKTIECLAQRSEDILRDQLDSYNSNINKSGIVIPFTAIFSTVIMGVYNNIENVVIGYKCELYILTMIMIIGWVLLFYVLFPKTLMHGFDFSIIRKNLSKSYLDVLKYKISSMERSFQINEKVVNRQDFVFCTGMIFVFLSVIIQLIFLIILTLK
ncbi:MAG: hypothetical protein KAS62_09330 [Candidatus Delongbacteria bacterium]|nr:hypothetical protein [Candidatus Delongbacteria bacterium]